MSSLILKRALAHTAVRFQIKKINLFENGLYTAGIITMTAAGYLKYLSASFLNPGKAPSMTQSSTQ